MGKIFLFLALSIGGVDQGGEIHVYETPEECQRVKAIAMQDAMNLMSLLAAQGVEARAIVDCVDAERLEELGIKAI